MSLGMLVTDGRTASVQDLGRRRSRDGIATGGALDQHAAASANALVGNAPDAPLAELLLAGLTVVFDRDALVAVTGATADVTVGGFAAPQWQPVVVPAGSPLQIGAVADGTLAYLAVAGRWDVPAFAGGVGPDAGLGFTTALSPGRRIGIDGAPTRLVNPWLGVPLLRIPSPRPRRAPDVLDVLPGPDLARVEGMAEAITGGAFAVDARSDHVGVRLTGRLPAARPTGEILSHGVAIGAVELPPADELIVLQRGRSLTAGYPVVAIVSRAAQDVVAQLRPGSTCRLRWRAASECVADARRLRADRARTTDAVRAALDGMAHPELLAS